MTFIIIYIGIGALIGALHLIFSSMTIGYCLCLGIVWPLFVAGFSYGLFGMLFIALFKGRVAAEAWADKLKRK